MLNTPSTGQKTERAALVARLREQLERTADPVVRAVLQKSIADLEGTHPPTASGAETRRRIAEVLRHAQDSALRAAGLTAEPPDDPEQNLSENARVVLERRYLLRDERGEPAEDAAGMLWRVARAIAEADRLYPPGPSRAGGNGTGRVSDADVEDTAAAFYRMMARLEFLPNSPTMMNAGTGAGTLSACFVLPLEDSMEGIMQTATDMAMVQKFGGGTGVPLSHLRPKGAHISTTHGRACGPIAVLQHLSSVSTMITQGGKRDGANMAVMDLHHPDILEFITCKRREGTVHNFNISVGVDDEFMHAVEEGGPLVLRDPATGEPTGAELDAREVFNLVVDGAWRNGEPGMIFLDNVNRSQPTPHLGDITATNPCGEQPLLPHESCNLGSINLSRMLRITPSTGQGQAPSTGQGQAPSTGSGQAPSTSSGQAPSTSSGQAPATGQGQAPATGSGQAPATGQGQAPSTGSGQAPATSSGQAPATGSGQAPSTGSGQAPSTGQGQADGGAEIDWDLLGETVRLAVHFLDNVIDANRYSVPSIERMTMLTRKIGLGVMGFADMLVRLGVDYDSEEGLDIGRRVMGFISQEADRASAELGHSRGTFPAFKGSRLDHPGAPPMRNACRLTVAPTGTISMIAGCSSGIEPIFALAYRKHNILEGQTLHYVDGAFEAVSRYEGFYDEALAAWLSQGNSLQKSQDAPQWVRRVFVTAPDIAPEWHVRMQAVFQESTDAAISKTVNFPNEATEEDVRGAYLLAWSLGCKGITVYRAGSRETEVLTAGLDQGDGAVPAAGEGVRLVPRQRPQTVHGVTERVRTGHGTMYITINFDEEGRPFEVFTALGKAGGTDSAQLEAVSRLVSMALRAGVDPEEIISQLRGITDDPVWDAGVLVRSAPDAVALALARAVGSEGVGQYGAQLPLFQKESTKRRLASPPSAGPSGGSGGWGPCPECSGPLVHQEGCLMCRECGYNKCG